MSEHNRKRPTIYSPSFNVKREAWEVLAQYNEVSVFPIEALKERLSQLEEQEELKDIDGFKIAVFKER